MSKSRFRPFYYATIPTEENLSKLNDIFTLYFALQTADIIELVAAMEFYDGVGQMIGGTPLDKLDFAHVEILK